jgi:hypothetical protein
MKLTTTKVLIPGLAFVFGGLLMAGCSSSGGDSTTTPEVPNLRGRVMTASPARAVAAPGVEVMIDGVATGEFTDNQGDFAMKVDDGTHTFGMKGVPGTIGVVILPDGIVELEVEVQDDGTLVVQEDVNRDGIVNGDDDLNRDGDINDDNDNAADDNNGVGEDNDNEIPDAPDTDNSTDNANDPSGKDKP